MEKHKLVYRLRRYEGEVIKAQRETPYEIQLSSRMLLDNLCFVWNKEQLQRQIDEAIDRHDLEAFTRLSTRYKEFIANN